MKTIGIFLGLILCQLASCVYLSVSDKAEYLYNVSCAPMDQEISPNCRASHCARRVIDGVFAREDIERLHSIVNKGLSQRESVGGPSILDINTGFIRDSQGLENLFVKDQEIYTSEDFGHYGSIIRRLRQLVMDTFGLSELYFTAPTFITRLDGRSSWQPTSIHDEYWHVHADMNSTAHYQYSGLLYMSTYGVDFQGGKLHFVSSEDNESIEDSVEPVAGRAVIFTSNLENPHFVERVTEGTRLVLAFWFTCDPSREFEIFLDGKAHTVFSQRFKAQIEKRMRQTKRSEL